MRINKLGKGIFKVILSFILVFTSIPYMGGVVYADENETDEDTGTSLRSEKGNIYSIGNSSIRSMLEEAAGYDIRMQYLITYSILSQEFGKTKADSKYNGIFTGNEVGSPREFELETNAESISTREVSGDDDGDPHKERKKKEKKNDEKWDKVRSELSNELANVLTNSIISTLGTDKKTIDEYLDTYKALADKEMDSIPINPHILYGGIDSMQTNRTTDRKNVRDFLHKEFKGLIDSGLNNTDLSYEDPEDILNRINSVYTISEIEDAVEKYREQEYKTRDSLKGYEYKSNKISVIKLHDKQDGLSFREGISKPEAYLYLSLFPEYVNLIEGGNDSFENYYEGMLYEYIHEDPNGYVKKYEKELKKQKKRDKKSRDSVSKDDAIVTWIPMIPTFSLEDMKDTGWFSTEEKAKQQVNKALEKVDGSTVKKDGVVYTKDGKKRTLRLNDLYYSKNKSSPLLVFNTSTTKNEYAGYLLGRKGSEQKRVSIGKYAGLQTKDSVIKDLLNGTKKVKPYYPSGEGGYNVRVSRLMAAGLGRDNYEAQLDPKEGDYVGIDSYGNIINTEQGTVLIPYWQNETTEELKISNKDVWVSHPGYINNAKNLSNAVKDEISKENIKENKITIEDIKNAFEEEGVKLSKKDIEALKDIDLDNNASSIKDFMTGEGGKVNENNIHALSMVITAGTYKEVKAMNQVVIANGKHGDELFALTGTGDFGEEDGVEQDEIDEAEYTAEDLLARIMFLLDYGFWELLRLTFASLIVAMYNSAFIHFAMSSVFHTTTIADTAIWSDLVKAFSGIMISFTGLYIVWMAIQLFRGVIRLKDFFVQFIVITLVILIPTVIYSPLINTLINKPTPMIVGKHTQQMSILDTHLKKTKEQREKNPDLAKLFGGSEEVRDYSQDYIIDFYTTQHKNGYDITDIGDAEDLDFVDHIRSYNAHRTGKWNKNDVIKVGVSMFDLYDWVQARVDEDENGETINQTLFEYLATNEETHGEYEGIEEYEEFSYDPNIINRNLGILKEEDIEVDKVTASELFVKLYEASSPDTTDGRNLSERIQNMTQIAKIVKSKDPSDAVKVEEVEAMIRDFSLTRTGRETAFGISDLSEYNVEKIGKDVPDVSKKTIELWERVGDGNTLKIPNNDYMNIESIIENINPTTGDPTEETNDKIVYNVNEKVLNDYINVQSLVRESVGDEVKSSEFMAITLNEFFRLNEELDLPMFPTSIKPETLSLDTYIRMIYIPLNEYKEDPEGIDNVAAYLSLRDNPVWLLVTFVPALVSLVVWGMIYLVVFGALMMILSVVSFIKRYIIQKDTESKAWLGTLYIIISFAIAKIGLLGLWYAMSYIMNHLYTAYDGMTYSYSFVHSIIIVAYVILCIKFIFIKVLRNVKEDPRNLGWNNMVSDLRGMLGNRSIFGGTGRRSSNLGREEGKQGVGKSIKRYLENEGPRGEVSIAGVSTALSKIKDKFKGDGKEEVKDISEALDTVGNRTLNRFKELTKGFGGRARKRMLKNLDEIRKVPNIDGTSPEMLDELNKLGAEGQIISTTADGAQIGIMQVGNKEQAEMLSKHFNEKGLDSKVNKNNDVVFNSTGFDMNSPEVRKGLYSDFYEGLMEEVDKASKLVTNDEEEPLPYTKNKDGTYTISVGDKGISTSNVDKILNSKVFSDSFIVDDIPARDENGDYIQGSLDVKPYKGVEVDKSMKQIFNKDSMIRENTGEQDRGELSVNKSVYFKGLDNIEGIHDKLADGMSLQGDKILYDNKNINHEKAINNIQEELREKTDSLYKDKLALMTKVMAQTAHGGDDGFKMDYINTSQNPEIRKEARSVGILGDNVESKVFVGGKANDVVDKIMSIKNFTNLETDDLTNYYNSQDNLYRKGEEMLVSGKGSDKFDKALNRLAKMGQNVGADQSKIDIIMDKYKDLGIKRDNADLLPDEYEREVEGLFADMQLNLQDEGLYTKALTNEISKNKGTPKGAKEALREFAESKRSINEKGVSADMIGKFKREEFNELAGTLDNIKTMESNKDGTVNVESLERLNEGDTARLINKVRNMD